MILYISYSIRLIFLFIFRPYFVHLIAVLKNFKIRAWRADVKKTGVEHGLGSLCYEMRNFIAKWVKLCVIITDHFMRHLITNTCKNAFVKTFNSSLYLPMKFDLLLAN